jgi:serine/threonine-protein kinase HipA
MKELVEEARRVVQGTFSVDHEAKAALANIMKVGTSAGGARAKAVIAWNPATDEVRSGQFDAAPGFEHWLLKFDGVGKDEELGTGEGYGRIEFAYYLMATAAGIRMSESRLLEENGRAHFMTKRFDREVIGGKTLKHHIQTLCAMNHLDFRQRGTHDYSQLLMTASELGLDDDAMSQIFRRMAFNVMGRNCDDHTKNFGFILRQGQAWDLSPAYDVTHAHNPMGEWTYQHLMSVNQKFTDISKADLLEVADRFGVRKPESVLSDVRSAIDSWSQFAKRANLAPSLQERVAKDLLRL